MRVHVLALTYTCNYILDTAGKSVREYVWVSVYECERERPGEAEACGVCYRYRATWPNADRDKGSPLLLSARPFASRGRAPAPIPLLRASISALEAKRERAIANEHRREREKARAPAGTLWKSILRIPTLFRRNSIYTRFVSLSGFCGFQLARSPRIGREREREEVLFGRGTILRWPTARKSRGFARASVSLSP